MTTQGTICNCPEIFALYGQRSMDLVHMAHLSEISSLISMIGLMLDRKGKVDK